ncbi:MAG: ABC transporter ATP-binding protein [Paludibacteraceae bacterium]|nr:ABC transporter ATP-binding protein [Paludibacteraceae bacterium]
MPKDKKPYSARKPKANVFELIAPYRWITLSLTLFALLSNGINLVIPKLISHGIDSFDAGRFDYKPLVVQFVVASVLIFIFAYLQGIVQAYVSEKVARDMREKLSDKISRQSYAYIQQSNPSKLLSILTSDIDSIKFFVSQAIVSIASSVFILIGAAVLLITINWKLGLCVLAIIPIIAFVFFFIFSKVKALFKQTREVVDWLNKVINESVMGAAIIRVLNSQAVEYQKFMEVSTKGKNLGLSILNLFATLMPIIFFVMNLATLLILALGGHFVVTDSMSLGDFAAFNQYLILLIFPIMMIGFMSNMIAQAGASYTRIKEVLESVEKDEAGKLKQEIQGNLDFQSAGMTYDKTPVLKNVSFSVKAGTKTAIIGPTAAGKSQLLYLLTGLIKPTQGTILFDGLDAETYDKESLYRQIGFVFQDSILFNLSLRENIAFSDSVEDESLTKAIQTAELHDFIHTLPEGLNTIVSERGNSLSGGQKQRIMLARALAVNPKILLLDDFTARVDAKTEKKILHNVQENYPGLTLILVTQKIASVKHFEQIILLMDGDLVASGTHEELMHNCPEYVQIYNSQRSTSYYEK